MGALPREQALLAALEAGDAPAFEESWRYSRAALRALAQQEFAPADPQARPSQALRAAFEWPETDGRRLVFVNGVHSGAHSDAGRLGAGVKIAHADGSVVVTLSGAAAEPLHLVYLNLPAPAPSRWRADLTLRVEGGPARVIEQHLGEAGADVLGLLGGRVELAAGAGLEIATLAELPDSVSLVRRAPAQLGEGAALRAAHALAGGRLQRFDLEVALAGAGARLVSRGVFALAGRQHADVHLDIGHRARDTASDIVWRGIADARARGVFHGAITVAEGADGADAALSNKNLLLSPHAEIDTQPVLEIHADEVKAAHGAAVGQLDEQALFYLRSRGVPREAARRLLIGAFARSVFADLGDARLRERIEASFDSRLAAARPPAAGDRP